jgi:hypothetical protein
MAGNTHTEIMAAMAAERMRLLLTEFDSLDDNLELNTAEVAVIVNRSKAALKAWDKQPNHPIKWKRRGKQLSTTVGCVRKYLRSEQPRLKRPALHAETNTSIIR